MTGQTLPFACLDPARDTPNDVRRRHAVDREFKPPVWGRGDLANGG